MSFRGRLLLTSLVAVLVPMIALAFFVRKEMTQRLSAQYEGRVSAAATIIEEDLAQRGEAIGASLALIRAAVLDDNRLRRAAVDDAESERRYLLDYAGDAMGLTGLDVLQLQDGNGRILTSGHFRNEYDRLDPSVPRLLAQAPDATALAHMRSPDGPILSLVRLDSLVMAGKRFTLIAGVKVEPDFLSRLARGDGVTVRLTTPHGAIGSAGVSDPRQAITKRLDMPFIDSAKGSEARLDRASFNVSHSLIELQELRASIDRWFAVAVAAAALIAVMLAGMFASRMSKPLADLAAKTSQVDLDTLDIDFTTQRRDEIGALSRVLGAMTDRLRSSAHQIKDAERRATQGELARQVNHDIKNGLTPIRNVFRHLVELVHEQPEQVPKVLWERQETLDSSISYLEALAANYARMSPKADRQTCDVNEIVARVVEDLRGPDLITLTAELGPRATVEGDPVSLRRVLENLIDNAIDSLGRGPGQVVVRTEVRNDDGGRPNVVIEVRDSGPGIAPDERARVFDDFYTTKADGTGLGLSIVRRLVMDLDGSIRVESEQGEGSSFVVELPAAAVS